MRPLVIALTLAFIGGVAEAGTDLPEIDRALRKIVAGEGKGEPLAGAALAVFRGDRLVYAGAAGCAEFETNGKTCARPLTPEMKLRVASISKMALALGLAPLIDGGRIDLDADVSTYLGWTLRNPSFPGRPITVRQLLAHTSSIRDPEEYWVSAPGRFQALFNDPAAFAVADPDSDRGPGAWFDYSNLNYGVLAGVIEGVTRERFDLYMSRVLFAPMGLDAGYNWSGVSLEARRDGAAIHRKAEGRWRVTVDDAAMRLADPPPFLAAEALDREAYLRGYAPGDNPTLFSPQGGLRASVLDLGRLVARLNTAEALTQAQWRHDPDRPNGNTDDGYFDAFGLGVQLVRGRGGFFRNRTIIGHPGEAYGLYSGAWRVTADPGGGFPNDLVIAFAVTGTEEEPESGVHPSFNIVEEQLMRLGMRAAYKADASAPAPFDEKADARAEADAALARARADGRPALMILGGNWCHDSRALAARLAEEPLAAFIADNFHPVFVDVGRRDRNLWLPRRFGLGPLAGTPTILIVAADGALLNREDVFGLTTADALPAKAVADYFRRYAEMAAERTRLGSK
jgi:CubicO group peptidase (beta-lactamase class C family)